jgi:hypothetical protein
MTTNGTGLPLWMMKGKFWNMGWQQMDILDYCKFGKGKCQCKSLCKLKLSRQVAKITGFSAGVPVNVGLDSIEMTF